MERKPKPGRAQKRAFETRQKIFDEALKLFLKKGFENTTVSEITEAVDVAKGTFFSHFPTKEAVMGEFGKVILERMEESLREFESERPGMEAMLLRFFDSAGSWHEGNRKISALVIRLLTASAGGLEADRPNQMRFLGTVLDLVRRGQEAGEFDRKVQPEIAAQAMIGVYFTMIMGWHTGPAKASLRKMLAVGIGLVTKGLRV